MNITNSKYMPANYYIYNLDKKEFIHTKYPEEAFYRLGWLTQTGGRWEGDVLDFSYGRSWLKADFIEIDDLCDQSIILINGYTISYLSFIFVTGKITFKRVFSVRRND